MTHETIIVRKEIQEILNEVFAKNEIGGIDLRRKMSACDRY